MNSLTQIQQLFAGLLNIYIIQSNKVSFGDIINGELQNFTLLNESELTKIPFTLNAGEYLSNNQNKKISLNKNQLDIFLPGNDLDQIQDLQLMDGKTYIILIEDRLNRWLTCGTPEVPLHFTDNYSTGKTGSEKSGRKISFYNEDYMPVLFVASDAQDPVVIANDFYLPSLDEMQLVYNNLIAASIGDFSSLQSFWTSTEFDIDDAYYISSLGNQNTAGKDNDYYVCAVRTFESIQNYNIGDTGEAGWVFYKNGNTYMEAVHLQTTAIFGADMVTGATDSDVGTGKANTDAILAADSTSGIAAKLANDYVKYSE